MSGLDTNISGPQFPFQVQVQEFPLHLEHLLVISPILRTVREHRSRAWIAGSYARYLIALFENLPMPKGILDESDVDIFVGPSHEQALIQDLKQEGLKYHGEKHKNHQLSLECGIQIPVQVQVCGFHEKLETATGIENLLRGFDYNICQFATNGSQMVWNAKATGLEVVENCKTRSEIQRLYRLGKFARRGFDISTELNKYYRSQGLPDYSPGTVPFGD